MKVVHPRRKATVLGAGKIASGQSNDPRLASRDLRGSDQTRRLEAAQSVHFQVHQDEIIGYLPQRSQRLGAGRRDLHFVTKPSKDTARHLDVQRIVVHDEHAQPDVRSRKQGRVRVGGRIHPPKIIANPVRQERCGKPFNFGWDQRRDTQGETLGVSVRFNNSFLTPFRAIGVLVDPSSRGFKLTCRDGRFHLR